MPTRLESSSECMNRIWFFSRSNIPSAVSNATSSIDTSALGEPAAFYSNSGCDIASHFQAQNLIFDITVSTARLVFALCNC